MFFSKFVQHIYYKTIQLSQVNFSFIESHFVREIYS